MNFTMEFPCFFTEKMFSTSWFGICQDVPLLNGFLLKDSEPGRSKTIKVTVDFLEIWRWRSPIKFGN